MVHIPRGEHGFHFDLLASITRRSIGDGTEIRRVVDAVAWVESDV